MFKNKYGFIFIIFGMLFLTVASVSAIDNNSTEELNAEDMNIESSVDKEIVTEVNDVDNITDYSLQNSGENNLAEGEGEFIDVIDAYTYMNAFRTEDNVWQLGFDDTAKTVFNTNTTTQLKPLMREITRSNIKEASTTTNISTGKSTTNNHFYSKIYAIGAPSTTIMAKKKVTFKAKSKTKKYTITLKSDEKPVKKVWIFLKIGKEIFEATTNNKGKATFKIKKLNKKGIYKAKIFYNGCGMYFPSSKSVKIKCR